MQKNEIHILIVDDDQSLGKAMKEAVSRAGFKATHLTKPDEALAFVKLQSIQAAVIDCMLPKMNGQDLAKKIKAEVGQDLPLILVSGIYKDKNFIRDATQSTGATTFLTKPFDIESLVSALSEELSGLVDVPLSPLSEPMTKDKLSAKERIAAVNDAEQVHGFDLPWIFQLLMHPRVNGHLNIIGADGELSGVGFQKGRIVQVNQKDAKSYFGVLMVEHGFISQEELDEVMASGSRTRKVGERLVEANSLSPHAIQIVMAEQQSIRLSKIVDDTSLKVNFIDSDEMREDAITDQVDLTDLLGDWLNSKIKASWLKSAYIPWLNYSMTKGAEYSPAHRVFQLAQVQAIPGIFEILSAGDITLEQAIPKLKGTDEQILRAVYALIVSRVLRFDEQKRSASDLDTVRARLNKLSETLSRQNYFERLGVSQKARDTEVKRAYHELAKILHPDKLGPNMPSDIRDLARAAFNLVNEAYEVLSDSAKKTMYMLELEQGRAEAALQAEQLIEQARAHLSKGDITRARQMIEEANTMIPPTSEMKLIHMWSRLKQPGIENNLRAIDEIREQLSKIPPEDRHFALYFFVKGLLLRATKDLDNARRNLEHAISLDQNFIDSRRELNILNASPASISTTDILRGDLKDVVGLLFKKKK
jgi:CheY-like chemotaxis protein/tetratricopeptide (TPR) repeat protein